MQRKQRFKNEILTETRCINSIIRFYSLSTLNEHKEGMNWYSEAHVYCKELADRFDITVQQVAGIIAAFSPQTGWIENKRYTVSFLLTPNNRLRSLIQILKAKKILTLKSEADIYVSLSVNGTAWKTKAFFLNILNPDIETDTTIDRHAIAVCIQSPGSVNALPKKHGNLKRRQYEFFRQCYIKAAHKVGIFPHQLQAITWIVYRRLRELKEHNNLTEWKPFHTEF